MENKRILGPTLFSFLGYAWLNFILVVILIIVYRLNWQYKWFVLLATIVESLGLLPSIIRDANWVKITDDNINIFYLFSSRKTQWDLIEGVEFDKDILYSSGLYTGWGMSLFITKILHFKIKNGADIDISVSMFSRDTLNDFLSIVYDKQPIFGFDIKEKLHYNITG